MFSLFSARGGKTLLKKAVLAGLILLFTAGLLFISCGDIDGLNSDDTDPDDPGPISLVPAELKGSWVVLATGGAAREFFHISDTTFSSTVTSMTVSEAETTYAGTIVNVRGDGSDAGYITIQYTKHTNDASAIGKYYVIHYKELTSSNVDISGAAKTTDPDFTYPKGGGKTTQAEAEETYTVSDGYFGSYSTLPKIINSATTPANLRGKWVQSGSSFYNIEITDGYVVCTRVASGYNTFLFVGAIVNVRGNYITLHYTSNNTSNLNYYGMLYYENLTGGGGGGYFHYCEHGRCR